MAKVIPAPYENDAPGHPGLTIQEVLKAQNINQVSLARRMGRPVQAINEIVKGRKTITAETALELEKVLGLPAGFWLKLEQNYQEARARIARQRKREAELSRIRDFPYAEMVALGLVKTTRKPIEKYENLLQFLNFASFEAMDHQIRKEFPAFRKTGTAGISKEKLAVWLSLGERIARGQHVGRGEFDKGRLKKSLPLLRDLTRGPVANYQKGLLQVGGECGMAILLVPEFKSFAVSGMTRWINGIPHVQISLRYKNDGSFWFSVFHGIGHIMLHGRKRIFIEGLEGKSKEEKEADRFARGNLLPGGIYNPLKRRSRITKNVVKAAAAEAGVGLGIVLGILQHDGLIPYKRFRELFKKLDWSHFRLDLS